MVIAAVLLRPRSTFASSILQSSELGIEMLQAQVVAENHTFVTCRCQQKLTKEKNLKEKTKYNFTLPL
jgi:hypothetical protein